MYVLEKVKEVFGDNVTVTAVNKDVYLCYSEAACGNENQQSDSKQEKLKIVEAAADIILKDICTKYYDTENYKSPKCFLDSVDDDVPETLKILLEKLIKIPKKSADIKWDRKVNAIAHTVISAVRPRSFLSHILLGMSAKIYKKYGDKDLIDGLSYLGLAASFEDVQRFETEDVIENEVEEVEFNDDSDLDYEPFNKKLK